MITPNSMQQQADTIANIYAKLEQDIFSLLIKSVNDSDWDKINADNVMMWQVEQLSKMRALTRDVIRLVAKSNKVSERELTNLVKRNGLQIVSEIDTKLQDIMNKQVSVGADTTNMLDSIVRQTFLDINNNVNQTLITTNYQNNAAMKTFQSIVKQSTLEVTSGIKTPERAVRDNVYKWVDKGIDTTLVDKGGNSWSLESYSRLVINATAHRTFNDLRLKRMKDFGMGQAMMSSHAAAREACAHIQGTVVNVVTSDNEAYNPKYDSIYNHGYGTFAGTQGANCSHTLTPFDPDVNTDVTPKQYDPDEAIKRGKEQQKQRNMERAIRGSKKRLAAAKQLKDTDMEAKMKSRISNQQKNLREFIGDKDYLGRDYSRESIQSK
ncbi:phage minor capsid protein [Leuconostoc citreum]|uniref:phage minor capsid protein n=1 Tax=Leuconostoc citreum TaxID=33964 RepID=UPI0025A275D4|nr:phage minor capsid protein [Leuconostoc citreum]MDM7641090.1 capsid protein [Leuconostoc citreum]